MLYHSQTARGLRIRTVCLPKERMPANACWERAFRTFSGLSAPASESTTERPDVSLPIALFTVTTDVSIACIYVCVLSRSLFTIYRDVIYNEIDRFSFPTVL